MKGEEGGRICHKKGHFLFLACLASFHTLACLDVASSAGLSRLFGFLWFVFSIIHGSGRAEKNGKRDRNSYHMKMSGRDAKWT